MTTTTSSAPGLFAALVRAQLEAEAVGKDATNSFHKYKYASAESIIPEARQALSKAGLAMLTLGWTLEHDDAHGRQYLVVRYLLAHGATGETLDLSGQTSVIPEKGRPQDKAEATALTYNLGYTLRGLLLLPRVEQSHDADQRDDRDHVPQQRQQPMPQRETQEQYLAGRLVRAAEASIAALDKRPLSAVSGEVQRAFKDSAIDRGAYDRLLATFEVEKKRVLAAMPPEPAVHTAPQGVKKTDSDKAEEAFAERDLADKLARSIAANDAPANGAA